MRVCYDFSNYFPDYLSEYWELLSTIRVPIFIILQSIIIENFVIIFIHEYG